MWTLGLYVQFVVPLCALALACSEDYSNGKSQQQQFYGERIFLSGETLLSLWHLAVGGVPPNISAGPPFRQQRSCVKGEDMEVFPAE